MTSNDRGRMGSVCPLRMSALSIAWAESTGLRASLNRTTSTSVIAVIDDVNRIRRADGVHGCLIL